MGKDSSARIQDAMRAEQLQAIVCSLPAHVLLLTGYWPVVGESIVVCVAGGPTVLLVPEDEADLAKTGFADSVETFTPETLTEIRTVSEALRPHLAQILRQLDIPPGPVGFESHAGTQAASYLAMHFFASNLADMLRELLPGCNLTPADNCLRKLSSIKTPSELQRLRQACAIAKSAFASGAAQLRAGLTEPEAANLFQNPLSTINPSDRHINRQGGFAFCMSGPNAAKAYAAFARTRHRTLEGADLVMIHCNSYVDGLWTDITRTFTLQNPDDRQKKLYAAVFAAREAALSQIEPNARAADVDLAARQVINDYGLGQYLKHGTGHGVGFSPMSAYSLPKLHAASSDVLKEGMVFNVEPAVYIEGYGGLRHCDMVAVTAEGYELLTDFQLGADSLMASKEPARHPLHAQLTADGREICTNDFKK